MEREVNALTKFYMAPNAEDAPVGEAWLMLDEGVITIDPDVSEETETFYYWSLNGDSEEVVGSVSQEYSVTAHRFVGDPAQDMVAEKEFAKGRDRIVWFRRLETNGDSYEGKATLKGIKTIGGDANAYRPLDFSVRWIGKPELTTEDLGD